MKKALIASSCAVAIQLTAANVQAQGLEEIIVTAQKRAESMQDVPIAVAAVTADMAAASGIRTSSDLVFAVASLNVTRTTEATTFTLRGIGTEGGSTGQDSAIALFVDGVYMPSMAGATMALANIERVEVLKGPQGTLFGRNATGGAVNIITKAPEHEFGGSVSVGYGNKDTVESNFYVTGGLTDAIAADLSVYYRDQDRGFGYNPVIGKRVNEGEDLDVRSKVLIDLGENTQLTLAGDYSRVAGSWAISFRGVPTSNLLDGQIGYDGNYWDSTSEFMPRIKTERWGGSATLVHDMGDYSFTSISALRRADGYQRVDVDATSLAFIDAPLFNSEEQFTQEFQLSYNGDNFNWIIGAFYMDAESRYDPFQIQGLAMLPAQRIQIDSTQGTESKAIFGQTTFAIAENTNLTLGARYTEDERDLDAPQFLDFGGGVTMPLQTGKNSFSASKPTYRVAIDHRLSDQTMIYASYNRGFKSGVYNLTAPLDPPVKPETLDAYEIGSKSDLLDGTLRLNMAAFFYDYSNIQLFQVEGANTRLFNAATAEVYGVDIEAQMILGHGFSINGSVSWLDHEYTEFENATISSPNPIPGAGNIIADCAVDPAACSAKGNSLTRVPDWTFAVALNHEFPLAEGTLSSNLSWAYNDGYNWAVDNRVKQNNFSLVNSQVMWSDASDTYNFRFYIRNLLDEKYLLALNENNTGDIGTPAPGRTFGIAVGMNF
ncbi:MAG: TonB-dependent receptor [Porticoccaceae bacterium]